jgi:hypothetical protein
VHFSGLAIADGRVYAVDHDSNVYCFGLANGNTESRFKPAAIEHGRDQLSTSWIGRAERQDEFLKIWIKRAGLTVGLALMIAIAGVWAGLKDERKSNRL